MELKFLGKGAAFYPVYGNTGAYMVYDRYLYLLDCGAAAFDILYEKVNLDEIDDVYVLMTHLHADHVGSLGTLISYFYCLREIRIHVVHPEKTVVELLNLEGITKENYQYSAMLLSNPAGLAAIPVEVAHVSNMKCYGYLLSDGDEEIYYSGDASDIPQIILGRFLSGELKRIYQDTSTHDSEQPSHCYYGKLEEMIPKDKRSSVYCMHLDSPCDTLLTEKGFRIVEVEA